MFTCTEARMTVRRALPALLAALSDCYLEEPHSRDEHRTVDQIRTEHRWAAEQLGRRSRRRFLRLLDALDRLSWMREATPRGLWASIDDQPDIDELAFRFERAARLRSEALAEADELAEALAVSAAPGALSFADLRRAVSAVNQIEASEQRVANDLAPP